MVRATILHLRRGGGNPLVRQRAWIRKRQAAEHPHHFPVIHQAMNCIRIIRPRRTQRQALGAQREMQVGKHHSKKAKGRTSFLKKRSKKIMLSLAALKKK